MGKVFQIQLLGDCRLANLETGESYSFKSRKARFLVGLVALWPGATISREKLASFLWDPAPEELARASLRQALQEIRKVMGPAADQLMQAGRLDVELQKENITVDVWELINCIEMAKADPAAALSAARQWKGELFGDVLPPAPVLEAWIYVERSRLRTLLSNLLTTALEALMQARRFADRELAEELIRIEPSHELAHQFLMQSYASRGDQAAALRQFARLEQALADELDSEPSQGSVDLLVAIKRGEATALKPLSAPAQRTNDDPKLPVSVSPVQGSLPKLAIRPPLTRYNDDSLDYLGEGFAGLLKASLSKFRSWTLLSWPSSGFESKFKIDFPGLRSAIGADYVVDTVLDWRNQHGQLVVSLFDCTDSSQVWSDVLPLSQQELQTASSTVAGTISAKLASRVNHVTLLRFARKPAASASAYDFWLRGHQLSRSWSPKADQEAQQLLNKAIEIDPGMACAYSSLAGVLMTQGFVRPGYSGTNKCIRLGFEFAQKSISLDPFDSRNHLSMGWSWLMAGSGERAGSHFKLAVDLNPFDSETLIAGAAGMGFIGDLEIAKTWADQALSINPLHPDYFYGYLSAMQYLRRDYSGAIATISRCLDVMLETRAWQTAAYAMLADKPKAIAAYTDFTRAFAERWEGKSPSQWADIEEWLKMAIPVVWPEGRASLNAGLERARALFAADNTTGRRV